MFYIQHGHGKAAKIANVSQNAPVAGVILSPAHEDMQRLADTADDCRRRGLNVLLDPQSYIYTLSPLGIARHHKSHGLEFLKLHWSQTADAVKYHVDAVLLANQNIGHSGPIIAPSPYQANLTDYWMPTALQYGRTSSAEWGADKTVASIVLDENVLRSWGGVQDWLDIITTLDVSGFYLLVNRSRPVYPPAPWEPQVLANLLRVIYTLTGINGYELTWGYADIDGLLGIAAGATAVASGWTYGLRAFSTAKWNETRTGGASPVPRVYLPRLWAPLRNNEVEDLFGTAAGRRMFPTSLRSHFDAYGFDSWSIAEAQEQYLTYLARTVEALTQRGGVTDRVATLVDRLQAASARFDEISRLGIALDGRYAGRVRAYREALDLFRKSESL